MNFKEYLITENLSYFGKRTGDVLNAVQTLTQDGKSMGTRQLVRNSEGIVNQIRNILHSNWNKSEEKYLKLLQKVGVAIMKAIEEKDDLLEILNSSEQELSKMVSDLGVPVNSISTPDDIQQPKDFDKKSTLEAPVK